MITVKLMGGLGNQMFQYAAARRLALHHTTTVRLDLSAYHHQNPNDTPRHYELGCFKPAANIAGPGEVPRHILGGGRKARLLGRAEKLQRRGDFPTLVHEQGNHFNPAVLHAPDNSYLVGYWQSEAYFKDVGSSIRDDFSLAAAPNQPNAKTLKQIRATSAVSLHVRRGDYVTNIHANKVHGTSTLDYYAKAVAYLAGRVQQPHFFVFSDDPQWCQENLRTNHPTTYVTNNSGDTGFEDLRLMSACQHHITANSSFSWWGAWLNPNPHKLVVCPQTWFVDPRHRNPDIYCEGWIKL